MEEGFEILYENWIDKFFVEKLGLYGVHTNEYVLMCLAVTVVVMGLLLILLVWNMMVPGGKTVTIVVLGDTGRSPRMQYHAISFAREGFKVDFVGYGGSLPHEDFRSNPNIEQFSMSEAPSIFKNLPRLCNYIIKVIWQAVILLYTLVRTRKSSHILVQNPPAIPTLAVCWLFSFYRDSLLVIDWHNYGYTLMALTLHPNHILVKVSKWYEKIFGKCAVCNMCVTQAMKDDLQSNWNIRAVTMYDRPPVMFQETDLETKHNLFLKLAQEYDIFSSPGEESTIFTEISHTGHIALKMSRPALVISSTSWTEDEDFSILLNALEKYELLVSDNEVVLPKIICVITGKGPLKEYYKNIIEKKKFKNIKFCTPWLTAEDYPKLLGSADIGVCLHKSSSDLDLPMKVVDMFGCGLPVCAIHFKCLPELVKHEENGLIFHNENELVSQLKDVLKGFPGECKKLNKFRKKLKSFQSIRWHDSWKENVLPLFKQ